MAPSEETWLTRLQDVIGDNPKYDSALRRSLQCVIVFEANRCVNQNPEFAKLRVWMKKRLYLETCDRLSKQMVFLTRAQQEEVMFRTMASRETMDTVVCWRRLKMLQDKLAEMLKALEPFYKEYKDHSTAVDKLIEHMYQKSSPHHAGKPVPAAWELSNAQSALCLRMYYRGTELDETFPAPKPPKVKIPAEYDGQYSPPLQLREKLAQPATAESGAVPEEEVTTDERRKIMEEVKEHLAILQQFEGIISDEELKARKRELFESLPTPGKRSKTEE